jgi:plasmid stability protein
VPGGIRETDTLNVAIAKDSDDGRHLCPGHDLANVRAIPYTQPMTKSERLEVRLDSDLRARVEAEAARQGRTLTETVRRTLESMLSDAQEDRPREQAGPSSVPSSVTNFDRLQGVRPAALIRTPEQALGARSESSAEDAAPDTESGKGTTTAPKPTSPRTTPAESSASPRIRQPMRRDVGPKPASASKPRPKATKPKSKP